MPIKIKEVKNFNKESDVLVVPSYVEVDESIKAIKVNFYDGMAVIKSFGSHSFTGPYTLVQVETAKPIIDKATKDLLDALDGRDEYLYE